MIHTPQLILIPLTQKNLETGLVSIQQLSSDLGFPIVADLMDGAAGEAVRKKLVKMRKVAPAQHPWFTYWLIYVQCEDTGVGLAGFKSAPGKNGSVEIGYGINPIFQGKGYMTEAVCALVDWAFSHPECSRVTATHVKPDNLASRKVLVKNGFKESTSDDVGVDYLRLRGE